MKRIAIGCALLLLVGGFFAVITLGGIYNRLVDLDEGVDSAWAQVENVYQRRADLVPNLVSTVKGAANFEQETLQSVVEARSKVGQTTFEGVPSPEQMSQFQNQQDALSSALSRLLVVVERYPELKATEAFRDLQVQLEGTENRIAVERRRFNEVARDYNAASRKFPAVLVARFMGFEAKPYFKADADADEAPSVNFGA